MTWARAGWIDPDTMSQAPGWLQPLVDAVPSLSAEQVTRWVPSHGQGVHAAVLVLFDEEMQRTDPEVESVEHRVSGKKDTDQDEPDTVQVESHGVSVPVLHRCFSVIAIQLAGISSLSSSWSGPCWIFRVSK